MANLAPTFLAACFIVAGSSVSHPVHADDAPGSVPIGAQVGPQLRTQSQSLDNSGSPVTLKLQYSGEAAENAMGGLHDGATYLNNILAQLHVDTAKALGWTGGSFALEGFYENANSLDTGYVGAVQDPSVIDTRGVAMFRVYQAYYKQVIGNTNLLIGLYDPETEFGITRPMDIFFNGAYAWNLTLDQSGRNGPSTYPDTSLAFRIQQKLNEQWSVQGAVLDGVPNTLKDRSQNAVILNKANGALLLGEVDYRPVRGTKILAGYWDYTGQFDRINQTNANGMQRQVYGSNGGYIGGATRLYSQTARRGLDGFINIGVGSAATQQVDRSLNVGLTYTGLLEDRPFDKLGVAVGLARAGNAYRRAQIASGARVETYETNFELTYRAPINNWLTIQPDIQYFINPNMDPALKDDLLLMVHFEISHVFDF